MSALHQGRGSLFPATVAYRPVLALLVCLGLSWMVAAQAEPAPYPVTARALSDLLASPESTAPASVISANDSRISMEVHTRILAIPVRVGEVVEAGDVVARGDTTDYELQVAQATATLRSLGAQLELAQFQLASTRELAVSSAVSTEEVKRREAALTGVQAEQDGGRTALARARADLDRTTLHAPFRGVVMERLASVGELASPGMAVVRLLDMDNLEVTARVRSDDSVSLEQASEITFVAGGRAYPLTLRVITPAIDIRDRSREVRLSFSEQAALPGTAGRLVWRNTAHFIPPHLLVRRGNGLGIFVMEGDQPYHARFVPLPDAQEGRPAITRLPPDTRVITDGRFRLIDDHPVIPGE